MSSGIISKEYGYINRRSIRLKGYDYTKNGAYFVTICTHERECIFGEIKNGKMILNEYGKIANACWIEIPKHFTDIVLDKYIIMPNHIHGIIVVAWTAPLGAKNFSPLQLSNEQRQHGTSKTIGSVIRGFKIGVTKWSRQNTIIKTIWQRNYYDRIIRDDNELNIKREYIINNPAKWNEDENNPVVYRNTNDKVSDNSQQDVREQTSA